MSDSVAQTELKSLTDADTQSEKALIEEV